MPVERPLLEGKMQKPERVSTATAQEPRDNLNRQAKEKGRRFLIREGSCKRSTMRTS